MKPCPSCGSTDRPRIGIALDREVGERTPAPRNPRNWVKRQERWGVTLSTLGRMIMLGRTKDSELATWLASTLPPPPPDPGDQALGRFLKLSLPVLVGGGLLAFGLVPVIIEIPVSYVLHIVIGLAIALAPLLVLAWLVRATRRRQAQYARDLGAWDRQVRDVEQHRICMECGQVEAD